MMRMRIIVLGEIKPNKHMRLCVCMVSLDIHKLIVVVERKRELRKQYSQKDAKIRILDAPTISKEIEFNFIIQSMVHLRSGCTFQRILT